MPKESAKELFKQINSTDSPKILKDSILELTQLYVNGLIENLEHIEDNPRIWEEQKNTLNALLRGAKIAINGYYQTDNIDPFQAKKFILPYQSPIITHSHDDKRKIYYIENNEEKKAKIRQFYQQERQRLSGLQIDTVIPIMGGGLEPAILISNGINVNNFFPVRYSRIRKNDKCVAIPHQTPPSYIEEQLANKNVLIVDDNITNGETVEKVTEWTNRFNPNQTHISTLKSFNQ